MEHFWDVQDFQNVSSHRIMKHEILNIPIDELYPNEYNANTMSEKRFGALLDTIKRNGQTHPIQAVKDKDGKWRIIGGEHKWKAMKLLKYKECQVIERKFEDLTEEQLSSLEDNIHGSSIPIREAIILAGATKKYSLSQLERRLGEDQPYIKDRLMLVTDEEKMKKVAEQARSEHYVEVSFIVDQEPKENAEKFLKEITNAALKLGSSVMKSEIKISKSKESVAVVAFNVSETQKNVIENAIASITKQTHVARGTALEFLAAEYLAGSRDAKKVVKTKKT